ncbi:uncharacterized protein LOC143199568 isoform X2 [Rhynchophorus ferrugineus]|uniref:uncharacterized protein LOC143199568 isoform X2 n=1 Tax=Rhynchophorus ferrugineus TaxID=354439 RepID=UPI003FCED33E
MVNKMDFSWKIYVIPPVIFISTFTCATLFLSLSGYVLIFLLLFIWFVSMCVTFVGLHKLLQYNEPIPFILLQDYMEYLGLKKPKSEERKVLKSNPESIKRLTNDLDKYFISKWYKHISKDENFPSESRIFIEEILTRLIDVQLQINNKQILNGILNIFLRHLKEYRRSVKRKGKYQGCIEDLYRYSHICSTINIKKPKEYFLHQLTTDLLRHFVNSELWNSLPCHILVSILARKFVSYLLNVLSDPEVINYLILITLCSDETKTKFKLNQYGRISLVDFCTANEIKHEVDTSKELGDSESAVTKSDTESHKVEDEVQQKDDAKKTLLDDKSTKTTKKEEKAGLDNKVILRTRQSHVEPDSYLQVEKSPKRHNPVKIYEPKSTSKTWRDSRDLACISLGHDPLDALPVGTDVVKTTSKPNFWETSKKTEENKQDSPTSAAQIFNEVIHIRSMESLKSSIKPISDVTERTLHNIKDLQETTVHNALHKIGDFQDEAAGVVEGILDFGRAGFRKGLRLTGLQDNIENAKASITSIPMGKPVQRSMKEQVRRKLDELRRSDSESMEKFISAESVESVWINPLESPICEEPIIYKPEQTLAAPGKITVGENISIPSISMELPGETDSPDPEYEDTADLASSIAKLRSLLQQRSSESNISTPALSPMPEEYFQKHPETENVSDVEALEVDGMMPNFYKFCAKTASGVLSNTLNTIKTALPGNSSGHIYTVEKWKFKLESKESDTLSRMKKLLTERKEYCILDKEIDTGYDALDSVDIFQKSPVMLSNVHFDDELDDFEGKMPITKTLLDIFCELLTDTKSPLIQEPVIKGVLLSCGSLIERNIDECIQQTEVYLADHLVDIPEESKMNILSMELNEYIEAIRSSFPDSLKYIIRKDTIKNAIKLLMSSLQIKKINEDILLQVFELVAMKLIDESTQTSPPASA